jgi:copper chaperone NosL
MSISDINRDNGKISVLSRVLLVLAGILLFGSIFFPMWRMELSAPQYPEGLVLQMYANKLAGNVASINDLNHYIGMSTLHTEDFIEFTILPYIIGFFGVLTLVSAFIGKKKWALITLVLLLIFAVVALIDFYRWNYNYGHNLSPTAAIKIPGMAFQPPLIGFKQLLNFGVYSIPDVGGIIMIVAGVLIALVAVMEYKWYKLFSKKAAATVLMAGTMTSLMSCSGNVAPTPIKANEDVCAGCKMTIVDLKFASEFVTDKGKCYVFDDIGCMANFIKENKDLSIRQMYVSNYLNPAEFLKVPEAFFIKGGDIKSPMDGNTAAFKTAAEAQQYAGQLNASVVTWKDLGL